MRLHREQRRRYMRIHRALDEQGFHLMCCYALGGEPSPDAMQREYSRFIRRMKRDAPPAAYTITSRRALLALLGEGAAVPLEVEREIDSRRSTWGSVRVDREFACACLASLGIPLAGEHEALSVLKRCLRAFEQESAAGTDIPEKSQVRATNVTDAIPADCHHDLSENDGAVASTTERTMRKGRFLTEFRGDEWLTGYTGDFSSWFSRRRPYFEVYTDRTTAARIAEVLQIGSPAPSFLVRHVRAQLRALACPGAETKGALLPLAWFREDFGREFWAWAEAQIRAQRDASLRSSHVYRRFGRS
jgi:hypothetical protein